MALYRFLFAPVLLVVAVLTTSPRRAPPRHERQVEPAQRLTLVPASNVPGKSARAVPSHPATVR